MVAAMSAQVPVFSVGRMTGRNISEWLTGMSSSTLPADTAASHSVSSIPPMPQ